jgi:hypothetical protein
MGKSAGDDFVVSRPSWRAQLWLRFASRWRANSPSAQVGTGLLYEASPVHICVAPSLGHSPDHKYGRGTVWRCPSCGDYYRVRRDSFDVKDEWGYMSRGEVRRFLRRQPAGDGT